MKYFDQLKKSMEYLSKNKKVIFIGQAVNYPGTAMYNTLKDIPSNKKIELPVAEEMQMGMTIGLAMNGHVPVSIYPRWNFLVVAANQIVNHLDKISKMSGGKFSQKIIIRTSIGSQKPLHPSHQHIGDFTKEFKSMCKNIDFVKLNNPEDIFVSYKKALTKKNNRPTILVEYGDFYNEK